MTNWEFGIANWSFALSKRYGFQNRKPEASFKAKSQEFEKNGKTAAPPRKLAAEREKAVCKILVLR